MDTKKTATEIHRYVLGWMCVEFGFDTVMDKITNTKMDEAERDIKAFLDKALDSPSEGV